MSQEASDAQREVQQNGSEHGHPTPLIYFRVAMILSAITAAEVGLFYANFLGHVIIPILALLSVSKFIIVAMYYMHLKFDDRIFSTMFVIGLILAAGVIFALMALQRFFLQ